MPVGYNELWIRLYVRELTVDQAQKLRGQQLEVKPPPHFTFFHLFLHFAWLISQALSFKILNILIDSFSLDRTHRRSQEGGQGARAPN